MQKLQISITDQEQDLLAVQAARLGYDVTKYVKFILSQEAYHALNEIPTYSMNPKLVTKANEAWKEYQAGKTHNVRKLADLYAD